MTATVEAHDRTPTADDGSPGSSADAASRTVAGTLGPLRSRAGEVLRRLERSPVVRVLRAQSLTAPGGVLLALVVLAPGVLLDAATDATLGRPTIAAFLLAVLACALTVRRKALATAAVLPPVLFAGAVTSLAWLSGQNRGVRQLVLDAGTTLALSAPAVFGGTALVLLVVLARVVRGLTRGA